MQRNNSHNYWPLKDRSMKKKAFCISFWLLSANSSAWELQVTPDAMSGKPSMSAVFESKNSKKLSFPYGEITPKLIVRKHPRFGRDVIFVAGSGQLQCRTYSPCSVLVKFDEKKPIRFSALPPSDGDTSTMFIQGHGKFIDEITKSKKVLIEVEFYRNGVLNFEFDTADFKKDTIK